MIAGHAQQRILLSPPTAGSQERDALLRAFDSGWIAPAGPELAAFERELAEVTGASAVVALSSGTAALHLALLLAGVSPGDDVLVQSLTFTATANAVRYTGAAPIFVDSDPTTWTIDTALVAEHLVRAATRGNLPRAVVAVDIFGQCADYDALDEICRPYGIPVIADAAESIGATYRGRPAGGLTDLGALSFNGNKMITTSGGGALTASSPDVADRARHLATQALEKAPHYEHEVVGFNYRLSNLLAALGRAQLLRLDEFVERRRQIRAAYDAAFAPVAGLALMPEASYGESNAWLTVLVVDDEVTGVGTDTLRMALDLDGIESRPVWKPMHLQPVHAGCLSLGGEVSAELFRTGLCLPSSPSLDEAQQERVIDAVLRRLRPTA